MNDQIEKKSNKKSKIIKLLCIAAIVVSIIGLVVDIKNTITYPGTDLRNRVVGARLMLEGIDPYFFKWQPGLSEKFYDPLDIPTELLSKLSVPPTVLALHSVIAGLSYLQQKIIWLIFQWAALIGTLLLFIKVNNSQAKTNLMIVIGSLFANSLFWRFHINSGQIYIIYVFLTSISWYLLNKASGYNSIFSGFFMGIVASLRPTFVLFYIPFIFCRRYYFIFGGFLGLLSSVSLSCLLFGTAIWKKYVLAMLSMIGIIDPNTYSSLETKAFSANSNIAYPTAVEGFDWNVRNPLELYLDNTSLYDVLNAIDIPNKRNLLIVGFVAMVVLSSLYIFKYFSSKTNINYLFLFGYLICLVTDFFIPVGRYSYYDIQMIIPLLIIVSQANMKELIEDKAIALLIIGFILSIGGFIIIPRALFFSTFLILSYILYVSFLIINKGHKARAKIIEN